MTIGPLGTVLGRITLPDRVTTALVGLIGTAELPYAQISWAEHQAMVSPTALLVAVADGTFWLALSDDGVSIIRQKVSVQTLPRHKNNCRGG